MLDNESQGPQMKHFRMTLLGALVLASAPLQARVYMVDNAEQLVAAIVHSNSTAEPDLIDMAPGLYVLDKRALAGSEAIPAIEGDLHIRGNGSELRRYDARDYQLLSVAESGRLHINRMTLAEGSAGAITNHGSLSLRHVRIVDNSTAKRGDAVIDNHGRLQLDNVIIGYNLVDAASSRAAVLINRGELTMVDTRFVDNRVSTRHPEANLACALVNHGRAELRRVSISGCQAEQLDMSVAPKNILNLEDAALLVEDLRTESVHLQFYGTPMTASLD